MRCEEIGQVFSPWTICNRFFDASFRNERCFPYSAANSEHAFIPDFSCIAVPSAKTYRRWADSGTLLHRSEFFECTAHIIVARSAFLTAVHISPRIPWDYGTMVREWRGKSSHHWGLLRPLEPYRSRHIKLACTGWCLGLRDTVAWCRCVVACVHVSSSPAMLQLASGLWRCG